MKNSYLIVKLSSLGDVIQSYFAAAYLKNKDPSSTISWVVEKRFANLVKSYSCVDKVYEIDTKQIRKNPLKHIKTVVSFIREFRKAKFDALFDIQGNSKSAIFTFLAKAKTKVGFSKSCVAEWTNPWVTTHKVLVDQNTNISLQYLSVVKNYFKDNSEFFPTPEPLKTNSSQTKALDLFLEQKELSNKPLIMICPNSNWDSKKLPENTLIDFLQGIEKKLDPSFIFIFGTPEEKRDCDKYKKIFSGRSSVIGALELPLWYYLMTRVSCVITMDSSALHLAALADTATFSFFGPSASNVYGPFGSKHHSLQGSCPYNMSFTKRCSKLRTCPSAPCISDFSSSQLVFKFLNFYKTLNKNQPDQSIDQNLYETPLKK